MQKTQRDMCLIPGLGRSPRGRHGNPLQYSCLKNPHGQRSLAGYSSWGHKELDAAEHKILYICTRHLCLILSSPSAWKHFIFSMTFSPPLFSPKGWGGSFKPLKIIKEACHIAFLRSWRESQQDSAYISSFPSSPLLSEAAFPCKTLLAFCNFLILQGDWYWGSLWGLPWEKHIKRQHSAVFTLPLSLVMQTSPGRNMRNPFRALACQSLGRMLHPATIHWAPPVSWIFWLKVLCV